jgi:hypothetical protein
MTGRKPKVLFGLRQAMGLTIGFRSLTKVIDIAIDSGYSVFVHKTLPSVSHMVCLVYALYQIRAGVLYSAELTLI